MARTRNGGFFRGVRVAHRWISMSFVVFAAVLILPVLPAGIVFDSVSILAIVQLVFLLVTGTMMAVRHLVLRTRRRPVTPSNAAAYRAP